jgi:hypothetical protein
LGAAKELIHFPRLKPRQLWHLAAGVFCINLDQACNKELLFLLGICLPIVGLAEGHNKASTTSPLLLLLFLSIFGDQPSERLNR